MQFAGGEIQLRGGTGAAAHFRRRGGGRAFSLIELLVVIAIIAILSAIAIPAIKSLTKSNDQSQATNLVRAAIANARMIAVSQHRMAGVVFFEETVQYSRPVNSAQTAMQLFVEDYNQQQYFLPPNTPAPLGTTFFVPLSADRQYLPAGIKLATLSDVGSGLNVAENVVSGHPARAILFDSTGQLLLRGQLATPKLTAFGAVQGTYPYASGDWKFLNEIPSTPAISGAFTSPGFFLYNKTEFDAQSFAGETALAQWLVRHADAVIVNGYTGASSDDPSPATTSPNTRRGFTLIELMVVIGVIAVLSGMAVPAVKKLTQGNSRSQAISMARAMISQARGIAIARHRRAGVVFFEETVLNHPSTPGTAMQLFVEDYDQAQYAPSTGITVFIPFSNERQYLPGGIALAAAQ